MDAFAAPGLRETSRADRHRRGIPATTLLLLAALVVFSQPSLSQQPGKPKDPTPLARPKPLCSINGSDLRQTVKILVDVAGKSGFRVDRTDWDSGEIDTTRLDSDGVSEDRVLLWVERDIRDPNTRFRVFFLYGRFEVFWGENVASRVLLKGDEPEPVRAFRQRLIDASLAAGP